MKSALVVALLATLIAPAFADKHNGGGQKQHNGGGNGQRHEQKQQRGPEDRGGEEHRGQRGHEWGRDHRGRFDRDRGWRNFGGIRGYSWGGFWFGCAVWPGWFYTEEVYFVQEDDGFWYAVAYGNPGLRIQVIVF